MVQNETILFPVAVAALLAAPNVTVHFTGKRVIATEAVSQFTEWEFFGQEDGAARDLLKQCGFQRITEFARGQPLPEDLSSMWVCGSDGHMGPGRHLPRVYVTLYTAEGYRRNVEFHNTLGQFMKKVHAGLPS